VSGTPSFWEGKHHKVVLLDLRWLNRSATPAFGHAETDQPDSSDHGTTRPISSTNTRRRVRLLDCPSPRFVCFMVRIVSAAHAAG